MKNIGTVGRVMQKGAINLCCAVVLVGLIQTPSALAQMPQGIPLPEQLAAVGASGASSSSPAAQPTLAAGNAAELVALMRPAIVQVVTAWEGTSTISGFLLNPNTGHWEPDARVKKPIETPYDFYKKGTGFVVSADGYVISNSHVVSIEALKKSLAEDIYISYLFNLIFNSNSQVLKWFDNLSDSQRDTLRTQGVDYIAQRLSFSTDPTQAILRPVAGQATTTSVSDLLRRRDTSSKDIIKDLVAKGTPFSIVYVNDKYDEDQEDFAVLKVAQAGLPYIYLGSSAGTAIGQSVYHFGYPGSADLFSLANDPTLTRGTINALKDSIQNTFKYLQTDAKLSPGSSGSPLLSEQGLALGIVTLSSGGGLFDSGDSFGFAFPIDRVKAALTQFAPEPPTADDYFALVVNGLNQKEQGHCRAAIREFDQAKEANTPFGDANDKLDALIDSCNDLIAAGGSIDSVWGYAREWITDKSLWFWVGVAVAMVVLAVAGVVIVMLLRRLKQDEKLLSQAERLEPSNTPSQPPVPAAAVAPVDIKSYIEQHRAAGETDVQMANALMGAGWRNEDVQAALAAAKNTAVRQ